MRIILNPMARRGAGRRQRGRIERELERRGVDFDLVQTEGPGHAAELACAAAVAGVLHVVAAGGDGTAHEVINGLVQSAVSGVALGLLPIGTGNDFIKTLPGIRTRADAFAALAAGRSVPVDVGVARWDGRSEHFLNAMGTGIDVEVVRGLRRTQFLPGGVSYVSALIRALARYRPLDIELVVDGRTIRQRIMNLAVCNGTSIGGSFLICPDARPDDGLFDICIIDEMPVLRNARMVPRVLTGTHPGRRGVTMLRAASVQLRRTEPRPLAFQLDGELREAPDGAAGVHIEFAAARMNVIRGPVTVTDAARKD
jgi:diacylglycerol kinase (ATP)